MGIKDFKTDIDAEKNGIWVDFPGFKVLIARASSRSNPRWRSKMMESQRRFSGSSEAQDEFFLAAAAEEIVKGWKTLVDGKYHDGIEDLESGQVVPATVDAVRNVLLEVPELGNEIISIAADLQNYKVQEQEEILGN